MSIALNYDGCLYLFKWELFSCYHCLYSCLTQDNRQKQLFVWFSSTVSSLCFGNLDTRLFLHEIAFSYFFSLIILFMRILTIYLTIFCKYIVIFPQSRTFFIFPRTSQQKFSSIHVYYNVYYITYIFIIILGNLNETLHLSTTLPIG